MRDHSEQLGRLARGWDEAADGYDAYFVPRFAPWVRDAVNEMTATRLPAGPILVPCCGTFPELPALIEHYPDRDIVGIDLSAGMVRRARERAARWPRVRIIEGDASTLDPQWSGACGGVVSAFGLQQLPEPDLAIRSWVAALRPAGRLSVVFWPNDVETEGPFALMRQVIRGHLPAGDTSWENRLQESVTAEGATIERDEQPSHPMSHADASAFCAAMTRSGPLRTLADAHGDAFMNQVRDEFLQRAPAGEWSHRPRARLIVAYSAKK